jgi:hypothetical protein
VNATHAPSGVATRSRPTTTAGIGTTYYRDSEIQVTQRWLFTGQSTYAAADLSNIGVDREACAPSGVFAGVLAIVATFAIAVGAAVGYLAMAAAGAIGALVCLSVAGTVWHLRRFELWATYRGTDVCLYRSHDRVRFGKITRAIVRARR